MLHEEGGFGRIAIVVRAAASPSETEFGVERNGGGVRFADFQKNVLRPSLRGFVKKIFEEKRGMACAPVFWGYCEIEDFQFFTEVAPLQSADNLAALLADRSEDFADGRASETLAVGRQRNGETRLAKDGVNGRGVFAAAPAIRSGGF